MDGVWSQYGSEAFNTVFVPPTTPTLIAVAEPESGCINLTYTADDEVELLYSKNYDPLSLAGDWTSIVSGLEASEDGAVYQFFEAGHNKVLYFKAIAHGSTGATSPSAIAQATLELNAYWIHKMSDPVGSARKYRAYELGGKPTDWKPKTVPEVSLHYFAGQEAPRVNRGEHKTTTLSFNLQLLTDGSPNDEDWQATEALLTVDERICVRTIEYDKVYICSVLNVDGPFSDSNKLTRYTVSFEMVVTG